MVGVPQSTGFRPVSLAHASVADYIVSDVFFRQYEYDLKAEPSHTFLAQTCLGYLLHYHVGLGEYPILDTRSKIRSDYPLALYAAQFWSYHLFRCDAQKKPELLDSTMRLLKSGNSQYIALNKLRHRATRAVYQWSGMQFPLCMCIRLGYMDGFHFLLNNGANVDGDGSDITPLHCAAAFGRGDIVRLLLDKGANIGGAMVGASRNGETDIVRLLLQNGADVDTGYDYHVSALEAASYRGHTDIVRLLLENGANPNLNGCRALEGASRNNYPDILDLLLKADANANQDDGEALRRAPMNARIIRPLLEHGADPNIDESYLLRDAANSGNMEIVQLLLKYDADVDATPSGSHTPLHCAACKGYTDIVRLLLDNGANAKADEGWALQEALTQGYTAIARMLLNQGVDVNVRGGAMLTEACKRGNIDDVRLLLDNGGMGVYSALYEASVAGRTDIADLLFTKLADVDCYDGAALWIASRKGHIDMVALLIERGVHVNPSLPRPLDSNSDTALTAASQNGHTAIVRLLLEKGAEVNADEGLALMYASRNNYREVVSLLLEAGADVNAVGGRHGFRTALQCASYQKHIHVMALLLENGATFNAEDELDENMLQSAALAGQISTVRLVLEKGAIDNRSKDRALHCAALKGHAGIVALLLQHGADVNANSDICCDEEDDEHEVLDSLLLTHSDHTALTCAVANGHLELVRRLLENGADIHTDALVYASKKGQKDALDILLESGVNLKAGGGEALTAASQQGRVDIVQLLLDRGVDVNSCEGMAFVAAAYCGHVDVVRLLSENGVKIDPEAGNTDHSGALVHAAAGGHINIVHFLLAKGANVNAAGGLALLAAAGRGHIDVARLLLENGADVTANNEDGTALQIAANEGHTEIASLLHEYGAVGKSMMM
ncbi:ankyrin repeat-containing domain protein [Mycena leptocephala]|nr:ankyrin repeat-containing domain protein [Mycena leptocephala]